MKREKEGTEEAYTEGIKSREGEKRGKACGQKDKAC